VCGCVVDPFRMRNLDRRGLPGYVVVQGDEILITIAST